MAYYPTIRQIEYLLALSEHKNFRKAAEACFVTQPSLSAAMQELEESLGVSILDRSQRKKVIFTPFGLQLIAKSTEIIPLMDDIVAMAQHQAEPYTGVMRLGLIPTIAPFVLPTVLASLQKAFPDMVFEIIEAMSGVLVDQLEMGQLDVALMAFPYDVRLLKSRCFYEEAFVCAAPDGVFETGVSLELEELKEQHILLLDDGHCLRDHALAACHLDSLPQEKTFGATSLQTILQMVSQGYGITLLPDMMVQNTIMPPGVSLHYFKNSVPQRQIGVAWRENHPQIRNVEGVMETLGRVF